MKFSLVTVACAAAALPLLARPAVAQTTGPGTTQNTANASAQMGPMANDYPLAGLYYMEFTVNSYTADYTSMEVFNSYVSGTTYAEVHNTTEATVSFDEPVTLELSIGGVVFGSTAFSSASLFLINSTTTIGDQLDKNSNDDGPSYHDQLTHGFTITNVPPDGKVYATGNCALTASPGW